MVSHVKHEYKVDTLVQLLAPREEASAVLLDYPSNVANVRVCKLSSFGILLRVEQVGAGSAENRQLVQ